MAANHHGGRPVEAPAAYDYHELLDFPLLSDDILISSLSSTNTSLMNYEPGPLLVNSDYNTLSGSKSMINASLHQRSHSISLTYCPPQSSKVLEFECVPAAYDDDDDETFWQETLYPTTIAAAPAPAPLQQAAALAMENQDIISSNICHNSSDSFKIDLPTNLVPASPCMSYISCSPPSLIDDHEIKEVISWADLISSSATAEVGSSPTLTISQPPPPPHIDGKTAINTATTQAAHEISVPSPTQSNANHDHNMESMVSIRVKTDLFNLNDGYIWRKYGEKCIKNHKFTRSYFRCARDGCKVNKRTERCSTRQEDYVFTYLGRHNHHP